MDKWNGEGEVEATKNRKLLYSLSSSVLHEYSRPSVLPSFVSTDIVSIPHFLEVFFFPSPLFPSLPFHRERKFFHVSRGPLPIVLPWK